MGMQRHVHRFQHIFHYLISKRPARQDALFHPHRCLLGTCTCSGIFSSTFGNRGICGVSWYILPNGNQLPGRCHRSACGRNFSRSRADLTGTRCFDPRRLELCRSDALQPIHHLRRSLHLIPCGIPIQRDRVVRFSRKFSRR